MFNKILDVTDGAINYCRLKHDVQKLVILIIKDSYSRDG